MPVARCNQGVQAFNLNKFNIKGIDLPDPAALAAAIYPDTVRETIDAFAAVETKSEKTYGQVIIDTMGLLEKQANVKVCKSLDGVKFKQHLVTALREKVRV